MRLDAAEPLVATVRRGARLSGRIVPADVVQQYRALALGPAAATAAPDADEGLPGIRLVRDAAAGVEEHPAAGSGAIAADGTFALDGVPPGAWRIELDWQWTADGLSHSHARSPLGVATLREDATTDVACDAAALRLGELRALVLHNGEPLPDAEVELRCWLPHAASEVCLTARTDASGRVHALVPPGRYGCELWDDGARLGRPALLWAVESAHVAAGSRTETAFAFASGTLRLRLRHPDGAPARGLRPILDDAAATESYGHGTRTDANGCADYVLPPGTYAVVLDHDGNHAVRLGEVAVTAQGSAEIELVVPAARPR